MLRPSLILVICFFSLVSISAQNVEITEGSLYAMDKKGVILGQSPLKHTKVKADISGFLARVTVSQEFTNNYNHPIEAVYTFPLSNRSAVDKMTMKIGSRTIYGKIKRREEARKILGKTVGISSQKLYELDDDKYENKRAKQRKRTRSKLGGKDVQTKVALIEAESSTES